MMPASGEDPAVEAFEQEIRSGGRDNPVDCLLGHCAGIYRTAGLRLRLTAEVGIAMWLANAEKPHEPMRYARMALSAGGRRRAAGPRFLQEAEATKALLG
jgi:hypothetical protein